MIEGQKLSQEEQGEREREGVFLLISESSRANAGFNYGSPSSQLKAEGGLHFLLTFVPWSRVLLIVWRK